MDEGDSQMMATTLHLWDSKAYVLFAFTLGFPHSPSREWSGRLAGQLGIKNIWSAVLDSNFLDELSYLIKPSVRGQGVVVIFILFLFRVSPLLIIINGKSGHGRRLYTKE